MPSSGSRWVHDAFLLSARDGPLRGPSRADLQGEFLLGQQDPARVRESAVARPSSGAPEGFELDEGGSAGILRRVDEAELDRLYNLRVTCMYHGGGPFLAEDVRRRDDGATTLHLVYEGDDREWALAQHGLGRG